MCKVWAISVTILTLEANFKISNNRNSIDQEFCLEFVQQRINSLGSSKKKKKKKKKKRKESARLNKNLNFARSNMTLIYANFSLHYPLL